MSKEKLGFSTGKGFLKSVDNATNSENTDFTNSEWIDVSNATSGATGLIEGATYEVVPYNVDTDGAKTAFGHGFITYDTDFKNNEISTDIENTTYYTTQGLNPRFERVWVCITIYSGVMKVIAKKFEYLYSNSEFTDGETTTDYKKFKYRRIR